MLIVTKARGVFWLYALLAGLGVTVTGVALFAAVANVHWDSPDLAALIAACRSFALGSGVTIACPRRSGAEYRLQAPNRMAFKTGNGVESVLIGERKMDAPARSRWMAGKPS